MNRPRSKPSRDRLLAALPLLVLVGACGDAAESTPERGLALLEIAERGDVLALDALLRRKAATDTRDSCDWTPLMKAALNGHRDAVRRLLEAGASVDAADKGDTPV